MFYTFRDLKQALTLLSEDELDMVAMVYDDGMAVKHAIEYGAISKDGKPYFVVNDHGEDKDLDDYLYNRHTKHLRESAKATVSKLEYFVKSNPASNRDF
tara:strand:- start:116 stop:412 length:297 start_codon:yes stop_codon:yes gene_type:complete